MPWVRIDENALNHAKLLALSANAFRLWVEGLAYCQKHLTDGALTHTALRTFRYAHGKYTSELSSPVDGMAPLWESVEAGYLVHDYLQWNESRAHVLKVREQARERIRKLRGRNSGGNGVTASEHDANAMRSASGVVSWSSSQQGSSTERERGTGGTSVPERAGAFCEWYANTHERLIEAGYIGNPRKDYEAALQMVQKFSDTELQEAATMWFAQRDTFATNGTRTVTKFASRASALVIEARRVITS